MFVVRGGRGSPGKGAGETRGTYEGPILGWTVLGPAGRGRY